MTQLTVLQRAFELAESGQLKSIEAIGGALKREGYRHAEVAMTGAYVRAQLTRVIEKATKRELA